jgi:hypothetical protein
MPRHPGMVSVVRPDALRAILASLGGLHVLADRRLMGYLAQHFLKLGESRRPLPRPRASPVASWAL